MQEILIAKLYPDAKLPTRKNPEDAGLDLYYYHLDHKWLNIYTGVSVIVNTGISINIPNGYCGIIRPKSKHDILIGAGVVDAGYQGEIMVKLINPTLDRITFDHGDAIAQLLIQPIETPKVKEVEFSDLFSEKSSRADTGGIVTQLYFRPSPAIPEDYSEHEQENWKQMDTFERINRKIE